MRIEYAMIGFRSLQKNIGTTSWRRAALLGKVLEDVLIR